MWPKRNCLRPGELGVMDWFWHVFWICAVVIPVTVIWIAVVIELFRRHDIGGWARVAWLLFILVFPVIGCVIYLAISWRRAGKQGGVVAPATATAPSGAGQPAAGEVNS